MATVGVKGLTVERRRSRLAVTDDKPAVTAACRHGVVDFVDVWNGQATTSWKTDARGSSTSKKSEAV